MDFAIPPLEKPPVSATEQVFDALYDAVISVKLPPGTKVSEAEIAKQLGVSRQPVRDAFFRLSNLGFLSIRPQRATVITQISSRALSDAVFTRTALEVECLRSAMAKSAPQLAEALQENLSKLSDAIKSERAGFHALDEAFHEIICKSAGHLHVWELIREQKAHLDRIRYLSLSEERRTLVLKEHEGILDAIVGNDIAAAEDLLRPHIADVIQEANQIKERYPSYFEAPPEA